MNSYSIKTTADDIFGFYSSVQVSVDRILIQIKELVNYEIFNCKLKG
ncbi:hypothetical protein LEP1GSC020_0343 [Leptospira interrogans serovar Grippotyphosa str. 2006006986]|uniref:Uncharacterized protein n=1 Tax=Leptospira interrogans serovar Manilae TaxID=214675 RepID=A0AAQ1SQS8_LEPIR|nr:hypothetical protein LEP1GSC007_2114 [Leptospira interrogans serovar Bulgarica str. Mallika]EKP83343.1 hypothetical protein LEP1GSC020_0343 [Leptospira interrogans serovar Grippotyphosa str. 2006006986]EMJ55987.1 hypothetical protein LEP1GSC013_0071 [Leptospira interrogans serovar Valbuzzi str. Duyster]EMN73717.1 hypothetical protein LEP1GSC100_4087 [Leptospira interrogans serovar Bataviae str. UI 08561]ENO70656.1 hypothetical protein LEP1GSC012_4319 [Leptospira interrogans serovar Valbuzzi 